MRTATKILGVMTIGLGLVLLMPPAIFLNERFQLIRASWGIFDIRVAGVSVSNATAGIVLASIGIPLFVVGSVLTFRRSESVD